jgi:hypothetical protein
VALAVVGVGVLMTAVPAAALTRDDGDDPGQQLSTLQTLGLLIGIPALVIITIWLLWALPSWVRRNKYRPGVGWFNEPTWFGRPEVEEGASDRAALPAAPTSTDVAPSLAGGGAHARW